MMKIKQMWWSVFGSLDAYITTRPEKERQFWCAPSPIGTTTVWAVAKAYPGGWRYITRAVLVRQIFPAALALVLVICGLVIFISLLILAVASK